MPSINLHIRILTSPIVSVENMISEMNQIFNTANISVNVLSSESLNLDESELETLNDLDTGYCMMGLPSDEQILLSDFRANNNVADKDIMAFFCRTIHREIRGVSGPLNGCASHPANSPLVTISSIASKYTLAHEIGHILGLEHIEGDPTRLMTANGTSNITQHPPFLIQEEIDTIINSHYLIQDI